MAEKTLLDIEQLKRKHKDLDTQRIKAEADLATANKRLQELKDEAKAQWGTDDIEELRRKLEEMKADNERKRADYQEHIEQIEAGLSEVEKKFAVVRVGKE